MRSGGACDHRFQPLAPALGADPVPLPQREVEHDLQLLGRGGREQIGRVLEPQLVQHVVELVAGQRPHGGAQVAVRVAARPRGAAGGRAPARPGRADSGDDVAGLVLRREDHRTGGYT